MVHLIHCPGVKILCLRTHIFLRSSYGACVLPCLNLYRQEVPNGALNLMRFIRSSRLQ